MPFVFGGAGERKEQSASERKRNIQICTQVVWTWGDGLIGATKNCSTAVDFESIPISGESVTETNTGKSANVCRDSGGAACDQPY
jgi:hypothetical protein